DRFARGFQSKLAVFGSVVLRKRNARVWNHLGRIEHAESKSRGHQTLHRSIDLALSDQSLLHRLDQRWILTTTRKIGAAANAEYRSFHLSRNNLVEFPDVINRATVRDDVTIEAPF